MKLAYFTQLILAFNIPTIVRATVLLEDKQPTQMANTPALSKESNFPRLVHKPAWMSEGYDVDAGHKKPFLNVKGPSDEDTLGKGDIFGLVTRSDEPSVNMKVIVQYHDGTLGIQDPAGPGYLFEGLLLDEYKLLLVPEPLLTVKLDDRNVLMVNDSLYNPAPIFSADGWNLKADGGTFVVCPTWNSVVSYVKFDSDALCDNSIDVDLRIAPITLE